MHGSKCLRLWLILVAVTVFSPSPDMGNAQTTTTPLLQPADVVYKGSFRMPPVAAGPDWSYGGYSLSHLPTGDPSGANDGYPGSLFGIGHSWYKMASEISIPSPVISATKNFQELPYAGTLQGFGDLTGGMKDRVVDPQGNVTLQYLPKQGSQGTDKLYWVVHQGYNVSGNDYLTAGWSELTISNPQPKGMWHIGPWAYPYHSEGISEYLLEIPKTWADLNVPGKYLGAGRLRGGGCCGSGRGPSLFVFGPWKDGNPPADGASLDAKVLLHYPQYPVDPNLPSGFVPQGPQSFPGYQACDNWSGAAWVESTTKSAVLIVGRKALGKTRYGDPQPGDAEQTYGYHCDPYEPQILFYNPDDLAAVAKGQKATWEPKPYAVLKLAQYIWPSGSYWMGGVAYDRANGLLYVVQREAFFDAYASRPLVHVFSVGKGTTTTTTPPPTNTETGSGTTTPPTTPPPPPTPTSTGPLVAPKGLQVR